MMIAGFKVDKTITTSNIIQILLLVLASGGVWLNGYMERNAQRALNERQTELIKSVQDDISAIVKSREALLKENDARLETMQDALNAHESRLNVQAATSAAAELAIRERLGELFDEMRDMNLYIRQQRLGEKRNG